MATAMPNQATTSDDPRRLRDLVDRARLLATEHAVPSVAIGLAAREGDLFFPELVHYMQSALRIEDGVFRMTRERAVLFLSDTTPERAEVVVDRLLREFQQEFPTAVEHGVEVGSYEIPVGIRSLAVKDVLPAVFGARSVAQDA